jgi:HPt (histidine-containing phosphotransfer) domain-containing protein
MLVEQISMDIDSALVVSACDGGRLTETIDWKVLNALAEGQEDGEPDLIVELIDLYLQDAPRWIAAIKSAVANGDASLLKRAAHTLKGSSGSVGLLKMAELCQKLEHLDCHQAASGFEALVQLLEHKFSMAQTALMAERQRRIS